LVRRQRPSIRPGPKTAGGPVAKTMMILGIIFIVALIGGIFGYGAFFNEKVELDQATGCPVGVAKNRVVLIFDQTDTFTSVQAVDIQNQFEDYKSKIPRYGELVVYAIRPGSSGIPTPIIRACNPGNAEDINQLVESSVQIARKWQESFDGPMRAVIEKVLQPTSSDTSPIIETMQAVVVKEFGPTWMNDRGKELIIVSDFLQYSPALSHYQGSYDVNKFIKSSAFKKLSADLRDVDVDLLYLYRDTVKAKQNTAHRDFWIELIGQQGGSVRRFYSVSG
jgi:hypothetical protein